MATVKLRQGIWCDPGKHLILQGGEFIHLPDGRLSCQEHVNVPLPEVALAGSLR